MSDYEIVAGATSQRIGVWLADSSSTTGAGLTGLAFNTASLSCYYWREDEGNAGATAVTLATATRGTFTSSGFVEKDATNMPGAYEFGIPNAAIASGAKWVKIMFKGATNLAQRIFTIRLLAVNLDDSVRAGLTALPNATAGANTGLPVVGTQVPNATAGAANGLLISGSNSGTTTLGALTVTGAMSINGTGNVAQTGDSFARIGATGSGLTSLAPAATALSTADWTNGRAANLDNLDAAVTSRLAPTTAGRTLDVTATGAAGIDWGNVENPTTAVNLSGTNIDVDQVVASVSGAVGSVTGNVGGNVGGSVGSVATGGIAAASFAAGALDAAALATDAVNEIADGFLNRDMSVGTDSGSTTVRTPRQALRALRNRNDTSTLTVYKEDDATASWTYALTTDAAADPITAINPTGP